MYRYLVKRGLLFVPTALLAVFIVFLIMKAAPGDIVTIMVYGEEGGSGPLAESKALEEKLREEMGFNRPLVVQFFDWVKQLAKGDLGESFTQRGRKATTVIGERFPRTVELAVLTIILTFLWSIPLGVLAATKADTNVDRAIQIFSVAGLSVPNFWIATLVLIFLAQLAGWSPPVGWSGPLEDPATNFKKMLIPVLILAYSQGAPLLRLTRAQMMEVLREDYVRTARAKGMSEQAVVYRHALRNSVIPIFTMLAWDLGRLVNGAVLIEVIFVIPGLGSLFVQAIANRDFALIQGLVLINVLIMLGINLVVDMVYGYLDPRIRYT